MNNSLLKSIVATIAYYDVFEYPLTSFEIWKYLLDESSQAVSLEEVERALETETVRRHIGQSSGLYFLQGRSILVKRRLRRGKLSIAKYKGVRKLVVWLRFVPFVRMIALTGSLAMKNSEVSGDWDLLIVLRSGHIWTGRALLTGLLQLFGKRRHGEEVADRACLNYWITTGSLEIVTKDLFSSNEYFFITPLFGFSEFQRFQEKNVWIRRFRPQYGVTRSAFLGCVPDTWWAKLCRNIGEVLLSDRWLEYKLSLMQKKKIAANPKTHHAGSLIEATDKMLVFLPKPQGPRVFEAFKRRLSELEVSV